MSNVIYPSAVRGVTWTVMREIEFNTGIPEAPNFLEVRIANSPNPRRYWTLIYDYVKNLPSDIQAGFSPYTDLQELIGFILARQGSFDDFLFYDPSPDLNVAGPGIWQPVPVLSQGNLYYSGQTIIDPGDHLQTATTTGVSGLTIPSFNHGGGTTTDGSEIWQDGGVFNGANAQPLQLVNNGSTYYTPLQNYYGGQFYEDVTDLNTSVYPLRIWANAVLQTGGGTNYTLSTTPGLTGPGFAFQGLYITWVGTPTPPITGSFNFYWRVRFGNDKQDYEQFMQFIHTIGGSKMKNGSGMLKLQTVRAPTI